jgi:4-hydroxythreonine-4-phosphate dehydrogenase
MSSKLVLTCGDPAGVGPEIISTWLASHLAEASETAVIGPALWLQTLPPDVEKIPVGLPEYAAQIGHPDAEGALIAWAAMARAAQGCKTGEFGAVVTGPISKEKLAALGWKFPGQTEFFADAWGGDPTMAFCGGRMKVVLLSWHIPLTHVVRALSLDQFTRAVTAADYLVRALKLDINNTVRIGVCGLNPHAGEAGLIGKEEIEIINPSLDRLRINFPGLSKAESADSLFARHLRGEFDVVVALYHDQGLAPLKAVDFDESVNVTLGLPFIRTSPDHGTAFSIAGKGIASAISLGNAISTARSLLRFKQASA